MFIKLTKLDNTPIWLNASFIVTVEPRRGGGSIVVPIGDGLDYEVREKAEVVLEMLGDAPAPAVVPVPTTDSLTATPEDVSPETEPPELLPTRRPPGQKPPKKPVAAAPAEKPAAPAEQPATAESAEKPEPAEPAAQPPEAQPAEENPAEPPAAAPEGEPEAAKPAKRTRKAAAKPKTAAKPRKKAAAKELTPLVLDDMQVERLKKMAPRSIRKLANTLMAQFKLGDPFETIRALEERDVFKADGDRVIWPAVEMPEVAAPPPTEPQY